MSAIVSSNPPFLLPKSLNLLLQSIERSATEKPKRILQAGLGLSWSELSLDRSDLDLSTRKLNLPQSSQTPIGHTPTESISTLCSETQHYLALTICLQCLSGSYLFLRYMLWMFFSLFVLCRLTCAISYPNKLRFLYAN